MVIKKGVYKHYKGPDYLVTDIAVLSGTENSEFPTLFVVYRPLYGSMKTTVRSVKQFFEPLKEEDGIVKRRFELLREIKELEVDDRT